MELVFVHGWGLGPEEWFPLINQIKPVEFRTIDLGFKDRPFYDLPERDYVLITHSLGTLWALEKINEACKGLIIINGFTRFTKTDDFENGVDERVLNRMIRQFAKSPDKVWLDFMKNAGAQNPIFDQSFNLNELEKGLIQLSEQDFREKYAKLHCHSLVLFGEIDHIVSPQHTRDCFGEDAIEIKEGEHLLTQSHPEQISNEIKKFLDRLI